MFNVRIIVNEYQNNYWIRLLLSPLMDVILLNLHNSADHTQPHPIITNYFVNIITKVLHLPYNFHSKAFFFLISIKFKRVFA